MKILSKPSSVYPSLATGRGLLTGNSTKGRATPYDRMRLAGYNFGVSENIALCDGAQSAHNQWLTSAGHHRNLLDPGNREVGIGADGRNWVQNFGSGNAHEGDEAWAASRGATSR